MLRSASCFFFLSLSHSIFFLDSAVLANWADQNAGSRTTPAGIIIGTPSSINLASPSCLLQMRFKKTGTVVTLHLACRWSPLTHSTPP